MIKIRTVSGEIHTIKLCKHIILTNARKPRGWAETNSEYTVYLTIRCEECKKEFEIGILVN